MDGSRGGAQDLEPLPAAATGNLSTRYPPLSVNMVLDNDDLLREIMSRLGFPVSLIHAALICKRWLSIVSDPAFLRRFRKLHPPLLGFYLTCLNSTFPKFVAMPHTQELNAIICRVGSVLDDYCALWGSHFHSRNSRLLGKFYGHGSITNVVLSPLNLENNTMTLPPLPRIGQELGMTICPLGYLLNEHACLGAVLVYGQNRITVHLYELIDGVWKNHTSSAVEDCPVSCDGMKTLLTELRLYIISSKNKILVFDFLSLVLSVVELPEKVDCKHNLGLSQADHTGFNLVHVKELDLRVWLYTHWTVSSSNSAGGNWLLVHTICLRELYANLRIQFLVRNSGQNSIVKLHAVGDNAEFVLLEICGSVIYLDTTSRMSEMVYTFAWDAGEILRIYPFMMIWPPSFPCAQRKNAPKRRMLPESQGGASASRSLVEMARIKHQRME